MVLLNSEPTLKNITLDKNNQKALYIKGFSAFKLNLLEDALDAMNHAVNIYPENLEFRKLFEDVKKANEDKLKKQKNLYKKMIFGN